PNRRWTWPPSSSWWIRDLVSRSNDGVMPYRAKTTASRIVDFPAPIGPTTPTSRRPRRSKVVRLLYDRNPCTVSSRGRIGHLIEHLAEELEQPRGRFFARVPAVVVGVLLVVAGPWP